MVPSTRRQLLHAAGALAVGLAGCSGSGASDSASNDLPRAEHVALDPDHVLLRNAANEPVAWRSDETTAPPGTRDERRVDRHEHGLFAEAEAARALRFADVDGVAAARRFVDATDFGRETLLLQSRPVAECYALDLCAVSWTATSYHTHFARTLRPADATCGADATDRVAALVRIPAALDPAQVHAWGSGESSAGCAAVTRGVRTRRNATAGGER